MATRKPTRKVDSKHLSKAKQRLSGLHSIDPKLDLGNGVTADAFSAIITTGDSSQQALNVALSNMDELKTNFLSNEKNVRDWNERVLDAVSAKYGKDSIEYEKAGGVRKSQRKRPVRKIKKTVAPKKVTTETADKKETGTETEGSGATT